MSKWHQAQPKKALRGLTGHNFDCVKATDWNFLPKCSKNNALFDHTVQLGQKNV